MYWDNVDGAIEGHFPVVFELTSHVKTDVVLHTPLEKAGEVCGFGLSYLQWVIRDINIKW